MAEIFDVVNQVTEQIIYRRLSDLLLPDVDEGSWKVADFPRSSAISQIKHRSKDGMLTVRFNKIGQFYPDYLFIGVPVDIWNQWKRVGSKGRFYHRRIKGQYNVTF
jgi:hypothetical protein